jgi:hypothetical protein
VIGRGDGVGRGELWAIYVVLRLAASGSCVRGGASGAAVGHCGGWGARTSAMAPMPSRSLPWPPLAAPAAPATAALTLQQVRGD